MSFDLAVAQLRTTLSAALLLLLTGCSNTFKSPELGFEMEIPKGHSKPTVSGKVADFGGGLQIIRVEEALPVLGSVPHDELAKQALTKVPNAEVKTLTSRREGNIGGVKVLRFELKEGATRGLLYIVPRGGHYFVLSAASSASDASTRLDRIERSFGTLKLQD